MGDKSLSPLDFLELANYGRILLVVFGMESSTRQILAGRYRLNRMIGGDAAFSRWEAQDLELGGETVEVVVMPQEVSGNGRILADIKSAVEQSQRLLHSNIASARAFVEGEGAPFFVFDHCQGRPLGECIDEWGKLKENEVKSLLEPLASALDYAHASGIIHGDIRPANIIVDSEIEPRIIGFCISKVMREALARMRGSAAAGPVSWMAPEQLTGAEPSPSQDIYSLAAIAYECMTGHPPFWRGQIEYQIVNIDAVPLEPETPFTRAVLRALSKRPEKRPATCAEMLLGDRPEVTMPEVVAAVPVTVPKFAKPQKDMQSGDSVRRNESPRRELGRKEDKRHSQLPARIEMPPAEPPRRQGPQRREAPPRNNAQAKAGGESLPPVPVTARRKTPTPEEIEERKKRLAKVEKRRRCQREAEERHRNEAAAFHSSQNRGATRKAALALAIGTLAVIASAMIVVFGGKSNTEMANAPAKKSFAPGDMERYSSFQGFEFGRVIDKSPQPGDIVVFGNATNVVDNVSLDGRSFELQLAKPVYKIFKNVRVSLVDTDGGRRISALAFEKNGEYVKPAKAKKVVEVVASLIGKEFGIDLGDNQTTINDTYFAQRYSDDFIDVRISSVVAPDSTSFSFSIESRIVRSMEIVVVK